MNTYVVTAGLTHRLIEADDATAALEVALVTLPRGMQLAAGREALTVRPATDGDVADFAAAGRRGRPPETLLLFDPPARLSRRPRSDEHA